MAPMTAKTNASIVYFESEGRQNLHEVVRVIRRALRKRPELRTLKMVIFTAEGQGPAIAYNMLREHRPKMIAVTFPLDFSVKLPDSEDRYFPRISEEVRRFFKVYEIDVIVPPDLPFDCIEGLDGHNQQVDLIKKTIAMFGSGFSLCIQAILRACDVGALDEGELVIGMSGDIAGLFIASNTKHFLNKANGLQDVEILCKPRCLTISRRAPAQSNPISTAKILEGEAPPSQ